MTFTPPTFSTNENVPTSSVTFTQGTGKSLVFAMTSPTISPAPASYNFIGTDTTGKFEPGRNAFIFNYALNGGVATIPGAGNSGNGVFKITFADSNGNLLGNFGLQSMYLAVGAGNEATVMVLGFRDGVLAEAGSVGSGTIALNGDYAELDSLTDLSTGPRDAYNGVTITFGTDFQFMDRIQIKVIDTNTPVQVDDIVFTDINEVAYVAPGTRSSSPTLSNRAGNSATLNWVKGSGDYHVVLVKQTSSTSENPPVQNFATYTANTVFGNGSQVGNSGWYAVFTGISGNAFNTTSPTVNVTGLSPGADYRFSVVDFNGNVGWQTYVNAANVPKLNFTTVALPSSQASGVTLTPITSNATQASLSWTNGNGAKRAVFVRATSATTAAPVVNDTVYTANPAFGSGTQIGATGWYNVYNGTGTSVTVTGLTPGTSYAAMAIEYNDNGSSGGQTHQTSTATNNPLVVTTPNTPAATSNAVTATTSTTATLNGMVDPRGGAVTAIEFRYSTDNTFTTFQTAIPTTTTLAAGASATTVDFALSGLATSIPYYYRVRATNFVGTTEGSVLSFTLAPPPVTTVGGSQSNVNISGTSEILAGATINGGRLSGDISNSGLITGDVLLGPDTHIEGGTLSGTITGTAADPAVLSDARVLAGTQLQHVIIAEGTQLPPDTIIGAGVRFESNALIPPGLDLSGALQAQAWRVGFPMRLVAGLNDDVLTSADGSILADVVALFPDGSLQPQPSGALKLFGIDTYLTLVPVRVTQGGASDRPGLFEDDAGNFAFITFDKRIVVTRPVLREDALFAGGVAQRGLGLAYDADGLLTVTPANASSSYVGRPVAAIPLSVAKPPGLQTRRLDAPANVTGYSFVFTDELGMMWEQLIVPVPYAWPELRDWLMGDPRNDNVRMTRDGRVTARVGGAQVNGRVGYVVTQGEDIGNRSVVAQAAGDLNGDGTNDYVLIYPGGKRQTLYMQP